MHLLAVAALDLGQHADAADQMLVDRVVMIHDELHHRDDLAEIRDEPAEQPGLVHAPQVELGIAVRGQDVEEQPVGLLVAAQRLVDQASERVSSFSASGWNSSPCLSANQNSRIRLTGSRSNTWSSATLMR